ncbi:hypothetical protein QBC42DRAFT_247317 [Cladorrhinum samala]|uniref:Uncharacterized protein n=1 Tax=Cladorrhinum samala TaxID=585594 RepID=A0AAV9I445_9PEZI|nr:hypothetical protein QBC42DRAFT_247317 [Cladorrhinum samala]
MASFFRTLTSCWVSRASEAEGLQLTLSWLKNPGAENMERMMSAGRYAQVRRRRSFDDLASTSQPQPQPSTQASQPLPARDTPLPGCFNGLQSCPPMETAHTFVPLHSGPKALPPPPPPPPPPPSDEVTEKDLPVPFPAAADEECEEYSFDSDEPPTIHIAIPAICVTAKITQHHLGRGSKVQQPQPRRARYHDARGAPHPRSLGRPPQLKRDVVTVSVLDTNHNYSRACATGGPHYFSPQGQVSLSQLKRYLFLPESTPSSTLLLNLLRRWPKVRTVLPKQRPRLAEQINALNWWGVQFEVEGWEDRVVIEAWMAGRGKWGLFAQC